MAFALRSSPGTAGSFRRFGDIAMTLEAYGIGFLYFAGTENRLSTLTTA